MLERMIPAGEHPPGIAFFDVDNTIVDGSTMFQLARTAWSEGFIGVVDVARFAWHQLTFRTVGETGAQMRTARGRGLELIKGKPSESIRQIAKDAYRLHISRNLIGPSVDRARQHLAHGDSVWLVTASPQYLGHIIATDLGLTGALGTLVEERDGVATGQLLGEPLHGPLKVDAIRRVAREQGVELADCWAYSDSINDVPMLTAVGHPVAVNPDAALRAYARLHGWEILGKRKKR
ncbi:MAG: hypothetical protein RIS25_530 [Actinomycetota bacterium]|jgi:HAD superfamily hydrolase (TIGR01490 family)